MPGQLGTELKVFCFFFLHILSTNPHSIQTGSHYQPHFIEEEAEVKCPNSPFPRQTSLSPGTPISASSLPVWLLLSTATHTVRF